jgi:hypothetical protein
MCWKKEAAMTKQRQYAGMILTLIGIISLPMANHSLLRAQNDKVITERIMSGQLLNVDRSAKLISVSGPDKKEAIFNYNDDTQVISPDRTMQGLVGKPGAEVRIRYREDRGVKLAISIELVEKR